MSDFDPTPDPIPNPVWLWIPAGALGAVVFLSIGVLIGDAGALSVDHCEDDTGQAKQAKERGSSIREELARNARAQVLGDRGMTRQGEPHVWDVSWEEFGLLPILEPARDILPDAGLDPQPSPVPRPGAMATDDGDARPPVSKGMANLTSTAPVGTCDGIDCRSSIELTAVCGMRTICDEGEVCCNPSCGICTEPGEPCSQEPCE